MEDEAPLESSYLSESKNSNNFEEESLFNLTKMLDQSSNPPARDIERPCDKIENITRETVTNEKLALKFKAKISAMKNYIDCELSEVTKKLESFSESVNQLSKMSDIFKKEHSLLLNENIELLKNELKSKDEMIKFLIETQTLVLETVKNSKASPLITQAEKETNHKIVEETPKKQKNVEKKQLLVRNLSPSVVLEDIIETFGLNSTKYLRENCNIELPMNLQNTGHNGYAYIIAPNHVTDELAKLNELKLKGRNLIIEEPATKPRTLYSNINKFISPNRYEALASSQEEENDFEIAGAWNTSDNVRYNRKKENEVQSPKSAKRRGQVVINKHPENQTSFGKPNTSPSPLLFNIYLNDLFFLTQSTNVCNFADDTTLYACDRNLNDLINRLEHDSFLATEWIENNSMKLNDDKCHLLVSGNKYENVWAQIGKAKIWESKTQKLLGVEIERTLNFDEHVRSLCKKAGRKLSVLFRLSSYMTVKQKRILMKSFFESQFGYCPLVWMFYNREINNKINHLHERALRIIYKDNTSTFEELLEKDNSFSVHHRKLIEKDNSFSVHHRNIQSLAIELFKIKSGLSNNIMYDIFQIRSIRYDLRSQTDFGGHCVNTKNFGLNSLRFFAAKNWNIVPSKIKNSESVEVFKNKIQKWRPNCSCYLCKTCINNVGFVETD